MALGFLFIITSIIAILILSTITISFFRKEDILKKNWFTWFILIFIVVLTIISFTALPSNYVIYKIITVSLGLLGLLGLYLNKVKNVEFKISIFLIIISLLGNFYIGFLM